MQTSTNYILAYYQAIQNGGVTVGNHIRTWYEQVVRGIEQNRFAFDQRKANRAIQFIERYCHHHEGALAPNRITLELWQKAFISVVFGIVDKNGYRQFREVVLIIGRKNGKTLLASAIASFMTYLDGEHGARVYFCAPKLDQARLCYEGFFQTILQEPEMVAITKKRRTDIYVAESNCSAQPLAFSARKSDGLNPHLVVCDEIAAWAGEAGLKQYEVLKSALGARRQPLLLSISTAGYVNDGIFDELMKRCTAVLNGSSHETRLAPFIYMVDDSERWNDINELHKSNPNIGVSVSIDYLLEEIAVAEGSLSKRAEFLCKYCNVKQNSSSAWLPIAAVNKSRGEPLDLEDFRGCYAVGGIDLSQTTDLTAAVCVIERDGRLNVFAHFWLPTNRIETAIAEDNVPYNEYIKRGFLSLSGENFVDYADCYNWFTRLVQEYEILPLWVGYDRYNALQLTQQMQAYGFHMDSVYQGTNLSGVINETYGRLLDGSINIGDNDLMAVHLLDAAMKMDTESTKQRLIKISKNAHVDGVAALLDAMCMRSCHYDEIGQQLTNGGD